MPRPTATRPLSTVTIRWPTSGTTRSATASSSSRGVRAEHGDERARIRQRARRADPPPRPRRRRTPPGRPRAVARPRATGRATACPASTSDAVTTTGGWRSRVARDAGLGEVTRARRDDGRGHGAVGEGAEQARLPPGARRCPSTSSTSIARMRSMASSRRSSGSSWAMTLAAGDAVETPQPQRVHPELLAPPDPRTLDGGDRVDERAVHVEEDAGEGRVERDAAGRRARASRARRTIGTGRHAGQPRSPT